MRWRDLDVEDRAVAIHEAGHGVVGELLGWRVRCLHVSDDAGGLCQFVGQPASPAVDVIVSAAGHAAEKHWFGRIVGPAISDEDREFAGDAFETVGVEPWLAMLAVRELEEQIWPIFADDAVSEAVEAVARSLAREGYLSRRSFLRLAGPALDRSTRRLVRRFTRRVAVDVLCRMIT